MAKKKNEENPFAECEQQENNEEQQPTNSGQVFDYNQLSDKAISDQIKYVRESLDGQEVVVEKTELITPTESDPEITAMNDNTKKYKKCKFVVTYDKKNKDGLNHREYLSGSIQFIQEDGSMSMPSFWYNGATNQVAQLWEKVAAFKKLKPEDLSPREFMGFLNSKPRAVIYEEKGKFQGKDWSKNLIKEFI